LNLTEPLKEQHKILNMIDDDNSNFFIDEFKKLTYTKLNLST
jgi:hypothetical protein